VAQDSGEAIGLGGEDLAAEASEPVRAASACVVFFAGQLFDEAGGEQLFEIVVERAGAELVLTRGLPGDLLHDSVTVEVVAGEGEKDVQ
jgi:hypothetical protein